MRRQNEDVGAKLGGDELMVSAHVEDIVDDVV
jgi:hypothetical protein